MRCAQRLPPAGAQQDQMKSHHEGAFYQQIQSNMIDSPIGQLASNHSHLVIPLISKRLNNVEKYINDFPARADELSRAPQPANNKRRRKEGASDRSAPQHTRSAQLNPFLQVEELRQLNDRSCVKYNSILAQKSEQRMESLSRLEKDYHLLKQKMHADKRSARAVFCPGKHKNQSSMIAEQDVERQLKSSVINQNGKKYFADLYLLKKGREEIMNSLSGAGKIAVEHERSYQQKLKDNEHNFVKHKILEEREVKRTKMLKGRNLHWNVYYDMLALSASQKKKLKGICKFPSTFGIA